VSLCRRFPLAAMNFVTDGIHGQMNLLRMRLQARGDRIEARLKFLQHGNKFFRSKFHPGRFEEKIDYFASPKKLIQFRADFRTDQFFKVLIGCVLVRHRIQKFEMRRANLVLPQKSEPNWYFFAFGATNFLFAIKLQGLQDFIDQLR
jgi:hypothetical protein